MITHHEILYVHHCKNLSRQVHKEILLNVIEVSPPEKTNDRGLVCVCMYLIWIYML